MATESEDSDEGISDDGQKIWSDSEGDTTDITMHDSDDFTVPDLGIEGSSTEDLAQEYDNPVPSNELKEIDMDEEANPTLFVSPEPPDLREQVTTAIVAENKTPGKTPEMPEPENNNKGKELEASPAGEEDDESKNAHSTHENPPETPRKRAMNNVQPSSSESPAKRTKTEQNSPAKITTTNKDPEKIEQDSKQSQKIPSVTDYAKHLLAPKILKNVSRPTIINKMKAVTKYLPGVYQEEHQDLVYTLDKKCKEGTVKIEKKAAKTAKTASKKTASAKVPDRRMGEASVHREIENPDREIPESSSRDLEEEEITSGNDCGFGRRPTNLEPGTRMRVPSSELAPEVEQRIPQETPGNEEDEEETDDDQPNKAFVYCLGNVLVEGKGSNIADLGADPVLYKALYLEGPSFTTLINYVRDKILPNFGNSESRKLSHNVIQTIRQK